MISVVMPAFNAEPHIAEAIESILAQTHGDFEFLILDDGSTDGTLEIIRRYEAEDSRIRVLTQDNAGVSEASNRLVAEARHPWLARLDADDVALPNRLQVQIEASQAHPDVVAWGGAIYHINAHGKVLGRFNAGPRTEQEFRLWRATGELVVIYQPTALLRRDVVLKAGGYDPRMAPCEDAELTDRMALFGAVLALEEPLALYRVHGDSASMYRFFKQRMVMRYIKSRAEQRAAGGDELPFETFTERWDERSPATRFAQRLDDLSRYHYRLGGVRYGEGRYLSAAWSFGTSVLMNPRYALPRVRRQLLSPAAARSVRVGLRRAKRRPTEPA